MGVRSRDASTMSDEDMVDRKDINEEHRKYLDIKDNPETVGTGAIFSLLSDGIKELKTELKEGLAKLEKKMDHNIEKQEDKITIIENDFNECQLKGAGIRAADDEAHKWIMRALGLVVGVSLATLSVVFWHMGIPFP